MAPRSQITTLDPRIILWMHPANERRCYIVTLSFIGWVHTQHEPCWSSQFPALDHMIGCLCCVTSNSYLGDLPRSIYTELGTCFTWCVCAYNCVPCRVSICSRLVSCSCSIPGWPCLWPWHWRDLETYLSRAPSDPPWHCHVVQYRFVTSHACIFIFVFYMQLTLSHSFYYPISFYDLLILCFAWLLYLTHWCLNKLIFSRYFRMVSWKKILIF